MKQLMKKGMSLLLAFVLILGLVPVISLTADATTVDYRTDSNGYIYNWGTREEVATFLSPKAKEFYEDNHVTYMELAALSGSSNEASVPSSPLYQKLSKLMSGAQSKQTSYNETKNLFQYTDCENNGSPSTISSFYSGTRIGPSWDGAWNREHTWPNSKGGDGDSNPNETDIMMLRPTSQTENSSRGNDAYGESSAFYHPNSESNGKHDLRGDVARIVLYVYVRWGTTYSVLQSNMWGSSGVMESKTVLLDWMEQDPVDTWEMGRNDSTESIIGTRNVFVDYPELAFELFEAEVPAMQTPSGIANSSYTVSAVSSNTAHGTVSVSGTTITATPAEGYAVSGYELLSGSAAVSRNGNVFLVTPASDCQIRINFAAKVPVSLSFVENGKVASSKTGYIGEAMTMPQHTGAVPENYTFRGWVTDQLQDATSAPATVYAAGDSYTPGAAQTFYALYSWVEGEGTGEPVAKLVTSANDLSAGMSVIIASANYNVAMSTTQNSNNRGQAAITKNSDKTIDYGNDVQIFTLEAGTVSGSYAFNTGNGYLYAASSSKNYLRTKSTLDANGSFKISVSSNGSCEIVAQGSYTRNHMEYNYSSALFSCYPESNQQTPVAIYAITKSGELHYTTAQPVSLQIVTQPEDTQVDEGVAASFTVAATGAGLTYQWQYRTSEADTWKNSSDTGNNTATLQIPGTMNYNGYQYRCVVTDGSNSVLYTDVVTLTVKKNWEATVDGWSLTLKDDIGVNFSFKLTEAEAANTTVSFTVDGVTTDVKLSNVTADANGNYVVSVDVAAAQMNDIIHLSMNGEALDKQYSVRAYAEHILDDANGYDEKTQAMVMQMLHYGAAAQTLFDYNAKNPVNAGYNDTVTNEMPTDNENSALIAGEAQGISVYAVSMVHDSKIALRYYFQVDGDIADYTFMVGEKEYPATLKDEMYYVEVGNIDPDALDDSITLKVAADDGSACSVTYGPMNYIVRRYHKTENANLKALLQQLYDYYIAAEAYVAP